MGLNSHSKQDLEDFKSYIIIEKNFSQHTAKAYYSDVLGFLLWMGEQSCEDVNFSKVREYLHFIQRFNYKKSTIARKSRQYGLSTNFYTANARLIPILR